MSDHDWSAVRVELGRRARALRLHQGLTQSELAERSLLSIGTISSIENGRSDMQHLTILLLIRGLGIEPEALLGGIKVILAEDRASERWLIGPPPVGPLA
jgi:transcriptional regulator with XRE-family HTH domain